MRIQDYIKLLLRDKKGKDAMVALVSHTERPVATVDEIKEYISKLNGHFSANRRREAIATALTLVMVDADKTIASLRRSGSLRASRYKFQVACVTEAIKAIYDVRDLLTLRLDRLAYLQSVLALHRLAPEVRNLRDGILATVRPNKKVAIKTLLVVINQLFVNNWRGDAQADANELAHHSAEELAESASTLFDLFRNEFKLSGDCLNYVDEQSLKAKNTTYQTLLIDGVRINKFKEAETFIDGLPYKAVLEDGVVTISSIDPDIEKSVRLGYIQMESQIAVRAYDLSKAKEQGVAPRALNDLVQSAFKAGLNKLVDIVDEPLRRVVFKMPSAPEMFKLFSENNLFIEEIGSLLDLSSDSYGADLYHPIKINDNLSSFDIFKIQRLFRFVSYVYEEKLNNIIDRKERNLLTLRSVIPTFRYDDILFMLRLVLGNNAEDALRLLTLDEKREYADMQYAPFIKVGELYAVAPRVVANSNLVRNIVCANNLRSHQIGKIDSMQQAVVNALETAGFLVRAEFEPKIAGKKLETDIFAWRDGSLFIFECKNAYHPCSAHEMRNSYDHLKKAEEQLDVRLDLLRNHNHQTSLFQALKWSVSPSDNVYSGIISANRVFNGAKMGTHPVRQAHEFINVVQNGNVRVLDEKFKFWRGDEFQVADLVDYLEGSTIISDQFAALQPFSRTIQFGLKSLQFISFCMDTQELLAQFKAHYQNSNSN